MPMQNYRKCGIELRRGVRYGGDEVKHGTIWKRRAEIRQVGNAAAEAGHAAIG